ncbi:hypothetical protein [Bradyrhizobium neotropicale]|uniref:hypothetical protein n=1 Tax=Bradyrhizobium neotropicale TaxID=1497615 RepID=UPI0013747516|nr:hypothetical protein [Bradyrhizobium neotropicale]
MRQVLGLQLSEGLKQVYGLASIEASATHICNPPLLRRNMPFALGHMPFSFLKVSQLHCPVHNAAYSRAGAASR